MDRKKVSILAGVLAVILLAVLLVTGRETPVSAGTSGIRPSGQQQTAPTLPDGTTAPEETKQEPDVTTEPVQSDPEIAGSEETDPKETDPEQTMPVQNDPKETDPKQTEPKETEPKQTEPKETEPKATEPKQTEPKETEPKPTEPKPSEPKATEPKPTEPKPTEPTTTEPKPTEPPAQTGLFPVKLENGDLTVQNLFQFTGMNPDADNAFGDDIAGIEMTNETDRHMTLAEVTVLMEDGTELTFRAEDIPAGRTVMAFSLEHASVRDVRGCEEVFGYALFESDDLLLTDLVRCSVDGIEITVTNLSDESLTDLEVSCHGLLESSYFGGTTYRYHISTLPAGASTVIYAEECILGMTEVVRIDRDR